MRLAGWAVDAFGRLEDFRADGLADAPVVVLLGANETGKSTFFEFVTTALYGFAPATKDRHPYSPWSGANPGGSLSVRLADGATASVRRRLRSTPEGRLATGDDEEPLANRSAPWVGSVRRPVFRGLHALTLDDAGALGEPVWKELEERLLGGSAFPFLRPAREAARDLDEQGKALWRDDRRGKPRVRELEAEIKNLKKKREEASTRDRRVREIRREMEKVAERLVGLRTEYNDAKTRLELLAQRAAARAEVKRLEAEIAQRGAVKEFEEADERLLAHGEVLSALADGRSAHLSDLAHQDRLEQERNDLAKRLAEKGSALFTPESTEDAREGVVALGIAALRTASREWAEADVAVDAARQALARVRERLESCRAASERAAQPGRLTSLSERIAALEELEAVEAAAAARESARSGANRGSGPFAVAAAPGIAILAWGAFTGDAVLIVVGALALAGVLVAATLGRRASAAREGERARQANEERVALRVDLGLAERDDVRAVRTAALEERAAARASTVDPGALAEAVAAEPAACDALVEFCERADTASAAFGALLADLPVEPDRLLRPDAELVREIGLFRDDVRSALANDEERARTERRIAERTQHAERLATLLGRELSEDALSDVARWNECRADVARQREWEAIRRQDLPQVEEERAQKAEQLASIERELTEGGECVGDAPDGDFATRDRVALETEVERLETERQEAAARSGALAEEERQLSMRTRVDEVDGEIEALRDEIQAAARERDHKALLANVLREAHRRYRDRHQPDVFRRASEYLRLLTAGRYTSVEAVDEDGEQHLEVRSAGDEFPHRVGPPLSRGTCEQIHLALRLALADHVDGDEPLPLVLDELFVNWDPDRTGAGLGVLREIGRRRQILLMTCHPDLAERARREAGAVVVEMPGPATSGSA